MSIVGLITEYNPFHNGHMHHLRQSKHVSGADVAVAIMGGHFDATWQLAYNLPQN